MAKPVAKQAAKPPTKTAKPALKAVARKPAPRTARIQLFEGDDGWRWRLRAANGETIAQSEAYFDHAGAHRGAEALRRCASQAAISTIR